MILLDILVYAAISRFWMLDKIPLLLNPSLLSTRLFSAVLSVGSIGAIFFYVRNLYKNTKLALLSSWVFALLPWTIEQGRIISQPNKALFLFLIILLMNQKVKYRIYKMILYLLTPLGFYFIYPYFWIFRTRQLIPSLSIFINNFVYLLSPDFFFFKNPTFWWVGVREIGIMHLALLPFLLLGIYEVVKGRKWDILFWFLTILFISSASPFFPESREFFFATPFISMIVAMGIYRLANLLFLPFTSGESWLPPSASSGFSLPPPRWILVLLIFTFILYDIAQFWHNYTIHYPQQIISNLSQIHEPF